MSPGHIKLIAILLTEGDLSRALPTSGQQQRRGTAGAHHNGARGTHGDCKVGWVDGLCWWVGWVRCLVGVLVSFGLRGGWGLVSSVR
jgi:hypothetical protein